MHWKRVSLARSPRLAVFEATITSTRPRDRLVRPLLRHCRRLLPFSSPSLPAFTSLANRSAKTPPGTATSSLPSASSLLKHLSGFWPTTLLPRPALSCQLSSILGTKAPLTARPLTARDNQQYHSDHSHPLSAYFTLARVDCRAGLT